MCGRHLGTKGLGVGETFLSGLLNAKHIVILYRLPTHLHTHTHTRITRTSVAYGITFQNGWLGKAVSQQGSDRLAAERERSPGRLQGFAPEQLEGWTPCPF